MSEDPAASNRSRVEIELEPGEPLRGSITSLDGRRPFFGWIELAEALESARRGRGTQAVPGRPTPTRDWAGP